MPQPDPDRLVFSDVVIDFAGRRLLRGGAEQALEPKAFAVLALLASSPGRVFGRDEILDAVWGHRHVTQSVLNRVMSLLRQALGEDAQQPRLLHTVYGIGYRFDVPATEGVAAPAVPAGLARPRWPRVATVAVLGLLVVGAVAWKMRGPAGPASPRAALVAQAQPSLAVLPFVDLSQARDQGYLADGLAEEIRDQLAQSPALHVVGRTSSAAFRGRDDDLRAIGRALDGAYLLEILKDDPRKDYVRRLLTNAGGCSAGAKVANISYKGDVVIAGAAYGSGKVGWTIKTVLGQNHSDPDAVFSSFAHLLDFEHIGGVILMCEKGIYDLNLRRRGFVSVKLDEPYVVRGHGGPAASSAIQLFNADAVTAVQFSGVGNNATGTTVYSVSREEKIIVKTVMLSAEALKNTLFAQSLHVVEDKATEAPPALPVKQKAKRKAAAK